MLIVFSLLLVYKSHLIDSQLGEQIAIQKNQIDAVDRDLMQTSLETISLIEFVDKVKIETSRSMSAVELAQIANDALQKSSIGSTCGGLNGDRIQRYLSEQMNRCEQFYDLNDKTNINLAKIESLLGLYKYLRYTAILLGGAGLLLLFFFLPLWLKHDSSSVN